jgi:hypothetical protein
MQIKMQLNPNPTFLTLDDRRIIDVNSLSAQSGFSKLSKLTDPECLSENPTAFRKTPLRLFRFPSLTALRLLPTLTHTQPNPTFFAMDQQL